MPSCAAARPGACPACGAASQPIGGALVVVGHGLVERQVRGPAGPGRPPEQGVMRLRRYRCRACRAILVVGPRGLIHRRWYGAGAIAWAVSQYAAGETSATARASTSPAAVVGPSAVERWATLTRWLDAAQEGMLFGIDGLRGLARRDVAEHVVLALAGRGGHPLGGDLAASAFAGAMIAS